MAKPKLKLTDSMYSFAFALQYRPDGRTANDIMEEYEIPKATFYRQAKKLVAAGYITEKNGIYKFTEEGEKEFYDQAEE